MIERATSCLHCGSKGIASLPGRLKNKSRPLYPAFWSHGAGDINLPSWWNDFLHETGHNKSLLTTRRQRAPQQLNSTFLDFLYPQKAIEAVQQITKRERRKYGTGQEKVPAAKLKSKTGAQSVALQSRAISGDARVGVVPEGAGNHVHSHGSITSQPISEISGIRDAQQGQTQHTQDKTRSDRQSVIFKSGRKQTSRGHSDSESRLQPSPDGDGVFAQSKEKNASMSLDLEAMTARAIKTVEQFEISSLGLDVERSMASTGHAIESNPSQSLQGKDHSEVIAYWQSQSPALAESFESYLEVSDAFDASPFLEDDFASVSKYDLPLLQQQMELTLNAGVTFLDLLVQHLYSKVLNQDRSRWTETQWAFLVVFTFRRDLNRPASNGFERQEVDVSVDSQECFNLLREAQSHDKAQLAFTQLFDLALEQEKVDLASGLSEFRSKHGLKNMFIPADTMTSDDSAQYLNKVMRLTEKMRSSEAPAVHYRRGRPFVSAIHTHDRLIKDVLEYLRISGSSLSVKVNASAYEKAWTKLFTMPFVNDNDRKVAVTRLLPIGSDEYADIVALVNTAYKLFKRVTRTASIAWKKTEIQHLLSKMVYVHHAQCWDAYTFSKEKFGFDEEISKTILPELSRTGMAERWYSVFKELESRNLIKKSEYVHQLLTAYAVRGDHLKCRALLDSLRSEGEMPDAESWAATLQSYLMTGDMARTLEFYDFMKKEGAPMNKKTSRVLLRGYAARGERVFVSRLIDELRANGEAVDVEVIEILITSYLANDEVDSAEQLLFDTVNTDLKGSKTLAWNMLLTKHAHGGKIMEINHLHSLMREHGIKENNRTYAALMLGFVNNGDLASAIKILSKIMPMHNMAPTIHHYDILISGLVQAGEYAQALDIYATLKEQYIIPNIATRNFVIEAIARVDGDVGRGDPGGLLARRRGLAKAEEYLHQVMVEDEIGHFVAGSPIIGKGSVPVDQAYASMHFIQLIRMWSQQRSDFNVKRLFKQYHRFYEQVYPGQEVVEPQNILAALGMLALGHKNHNEVLKLWNKALANGERFSARTNADRTKPNWILPSRSALISPMFNIYSRSLRAQEKHDQLDEIFEALLTAGWRFLSSLMNTQIVSLARRGKLLKALHYMEQYMMSGFRGWPAAMEYGMNPVGVINRKGKPRQRRIMNPDYQTFCWLTKAYADFRQEIAFSPDRAALLAELWGVAPNALTAITYMPRVNDNIQLRIIKGRPPMTKYKSVELARERRQSR